MYQRLRRLEPDISGSFDAMCWLMTGNQEQSILRIGDEYNWPSVKCYVHEWHQTVVIRQQPVSITNTFQHTTFHESNVVDVVVCTCLCTCFTRVGKVSTGFWLGLSRGVFTCIGWQVTMIPYGKWHPVAVRWSFIQSCNLLNLLFSTYGLNSTKVRRQNITVKITQRNI